MSEQFNCEPEIHLELEYDHSDKEWFSIQVANCERCDKKECEYWSFYNE